MNSFTEFACLERLTFHNFVSVTKGRLTNQFFSHKASFGRWGVDAFKNQ